MKLTYIFHSGFALETDRCILVFDYWMDPNNVMSSIIERHEQKPIYVFASHFHEDHFSRRIFEWRDSCHPTYILSKDILKRRRASQEEADVWMVKGDTWSDQNIKVIATGSNDSGVSWIVEIQDVTSGEVATRRIFHAGDLCNWYARFLSEPQVPETIISQEFGEIHPLTEEKQYLGELKDIRKVTDSFDLVLFPVDGRIGNGYTLGARQFIERFKVRLFVPMHFVASGFESAWRMEPFCAEQQIAFWSIRAEGESISIIDDIFIRNTNIDDLPRLQEIFAIARDFMARTGNPNQWAPDYPSNEQLTNDIESGDSYVCVKGSHIVGTFLLRGGIDPTYLNIRAGAWINEQPYATIHRIASSGETKGIFRLALHFALQQYSNIRIDTHRDNAVMQKIIEQNGFRYCGIIYCWNGSERLAYQYSHD